MLKTKEQLLTYFTNHISLSTYDQKFINNLEYLIFKNQQVTTNQKNLFEKLISKYSKQFAKYNLDSNILLELPWLTKIVESSTKYTGAQVSMVRGELILKVPFNKKFISDLRDLENNTFEWNRNNKNYVSPFNTMGLKAIVKLLPKHFNHITYDSNVGKLISEVEKFNADIWNPTLVFVNGYYIIGAINSGIYNNVKDIELNDDTKTLFKLSQLSITIDKSIVSNDPKKIFASNPIAEIDSEDLTTVVSWLKELEVRKVYYGRGLNYHQSISLGELLRKENTTKILGTVKDNLKKLNIKYGGSGSFFSDPENEICVMIQTLSRVDSLFYHAGKRISKYIILRDSTPIDIK